jgi:hypothetical protein
VQYRERLGGLLRYDHQDAARIGVRLADHRGPAVRRQSHYTDHRPSSRASLSGVGGSRQKIERALKNQSKRIFGRTSQKSSFGSEFLPYGVAA